MLSLETCLKLKEAGWPQLTTFSSMFGRFGYYERGVCILCTSSRSDNVLLAIVPTLEELLEAVHRECPQTEVSLSLRVGDNWLCEMVVDERRLVGLKADPSEAVAALWLKLKAGA